MSEVINNPLDDPFLSKVIGNSKKWLNIYSGAVRSSKTVTSMFPFFAHAYNISKQHLDYRFLLVGNTVNSLKDNFLIPFQAFVGKSNFQFSLSKKEANLFGCHCFLEGASTVECVSKIKGKTAKGGGVFDEIVTWADGVLDMATSRMTSDEGRFFATCNPGPPLHYVKKNYIDRAEELNIYVANFTIDDNPFLSEQVKTREKRKYQGFAYQRYILGKWALADGIIYDMFNPDKYVVECRNIQFKNYIVGVDYGTSNPCTFAVYGFNDDSKVYLVDRYWHDSVKKLKQKTDSEYREDFVEFIGPYRNKIHGIYCDPSASSFILELRRAGYKVTKANNDVYEGIMFLSDWIAKDKLFIDKSCKHDIEEFQSYCWDARKQAVGEDAPLKENDHAMDSMRYAIYTHFFKRYVSTKRKFY